MDSDEDWPDDDSDDSIVVRCPNCRADVYEDAEQCPHCGEWIEHSTHPLSGRPQWFIWLGLIGIAVAVAALVLAGF